MSRIHSFHYHQFVPPKKESLFSPKSLIFWGLNFLTLGGIYGAVEAVMKFHRFKHLNIVQENFLSQAETIVAQWDLLETQMTGVLDELKSLREEDREKVEIKEKIENFSAKIIQLNKLAIEDKKESARTISEMAWRVISFVGNLIGNIFTLGYLGAYQHHKYTYEVHLLETQNTFIKEQFDNQKAAALNRFQKMVGISHDYFHSKTSYYGIKNTEPGKAYAAVQKAKQELTALQKDQKALQANFDAMKVDHAAKLEACATEHNLTKKELKEVQEKFNDANAKAAKASALEKEIENLKAAQKNQPQLSKLATQLGSFLPVFVPAEDKDKKIDKKLVSGAIDIQDKDFKNSLSPAQLSYFEEYNARYKDKKSAHEAIKEAFGYAYDSLINMAKEGKKIKLNNSPMTIKTDGAFAVYNFMILDLIKGGKVTYEGCDGHVLKIHDELWMRPSEAEKIIHYNDQGKPEVIVHYKYKDDFTPSELVAESEGVFNGVNAVEAKWILEELSEKEKNYLFTSLMSDLIEDSHPDHQDMVAFMENINDPRVKLIERASALIKDLGKVVGRKFNQSVIANAWYAKTVPPEDSEDEEITTIAPFVKPEKIKKKELLEKIAKQEIIKISDKVVDWEFDPDVLSDKRSDNKVRQKDFLDLMLASKENYQTVANAFGQVDLLEYPELPNQKFNHLSLEQVGNHFHVSHQMIGLDQNGKGGERCLFSNLLAILVTNKKDLTVDNVHKLKKAMANYLDKLQQAYAKWGIEKSKAANLQSKNAPKLKEMSELYKLFEQSIIKTHTCTVKGYINWLRNEYPAPVIDAGDLTTLEIQLAAYTFGVRIGLLPIAYNSPSKTDEFGRILPEGEFYGPNTKETLLMGLFHPMDGKAGSYYGLYPRLNVGKGENQYGKGNIYLYHAALNIKTYWKGIQLFKSKAEIK